MFRSKLLRNTTIFLQIYLFCMIPVLAVEKMQNVEMLSISWTHVPSHKSMISDLMSISSPIRYKLRVDKGAKCNLVLGFVERYWQEPGKRVMDVDAEGGKIETVDVIKSVGNRMPYAIEIPCEDTNMDGWISLEIRQHPGVVDPNPLLNALWLFDRSYWSANALTANDILTGKHDTHALYMIDAGLDGSELVEHDCTTDFAKATDYMSALKTVMESHPSLLNEWSAQVAPLSESVLKISSGSITDGKSIVNQLDEFRSTIRGSIIKVYNTKYDKPVESRLFSPWGALIRVRHEGSLRVNMQMLSPHPESNDYKYHSWDARRSLPGWIEFTPDTGISRLSSALNYGINLDLKTVKYDPFKTVYTYNKGNIAVQILHKSALGIFGNGIRFNAHFDRAGMKHEGRLWYSSLNISNNSATQKDPFYVGIITDSADITKSGAAISNAAIVWGDSLKELRSTASRVYNWVSTRREADRWGKQFDSDLVLKGRTPYPSMMNLNRRAVASMQYLSGPLFAALDGGYTQIWVRDTTSAVVHTALGGDPLYLKKWTPYLMNNPTHESLNGKDYTVFWAFPTLKIEKQQDGQYYATRAAYTYWKLTGDSSRLKEWYPTLKNAMEYQRAVYYDAKLGLYCEININEAALKEAGEWVMGEQFLDLKINNVWPLRSFDLYINNLMYATHMMQAEMAKELGNTTDYVRNLRMARDLSESIDKNLWDEKAGHYICGKSLLEDGRMVDFDWNYWDTFFDYVWAGTLYPMTPDPEKMLRSLNAMMEQRKGNWPGGANFAPSLVHSSYVLTAAGDSERAEKYLDVVTEPSRKDGWNDEMNAQYIMNDAIIENLYVPYLHRPQTFTIGPWIHAVTARCVYLDCNGVTIIPGGMITGAKGVRFKEAILNVDTSGVQQAGGIIIDGKVLPGTLRIPMDILTPGKHSVKLMKTSDADKILLAHTDFELRKIDVGKTEATYTLYGYGCGVLRIEGKINSVEVTDSSGKKMKYKLWSDKTGTRVQVDASGQFTVTVK